MSHVLEAVRRLVVEHLGVEPPRVKPEATWDDLGADSLDRVELAMWFEDEFDIELTDEELESLMTIGDAVALIERKLA